MSSGSPGRQLPSTWERAPMRRVRSTSCRPRASWPGSHARRAEGTSSWRRRAPRPRPTRRRPPWPCPPPRADGPPTPHHRRGTPGRRPSAGTSTSKMTCTNGAPWRGPPHRDRAGSRCRRGGAQLGDVIRPRRTGRQRQLVRDPVVSEHVGEVAAGEVVAIPHEVHQALARRTDPSVRVSGRRGRGCWHTRST